MHGIGLLRISQTPVTVDTEEYVVFIHGWLAPHGFASWSEANAYMQERMKAARVSSQKRLRSGEPRAPGLRPGQKSYLNGVKKQTETAND